MFWFCCEDRTSNINSTVYGVCIYVYIYVVSMLFVSQCFQAVPVLLSAFSHFYLFIFVFVWWWQQWNDTRNFKKVSTYCLSVFLATGYFLQTVVCPWGWVWPRCELLPELYLSIYSLNFSLLLPHLYAQLRPPPLFPFSSSSSTLSWSCPSRSSKPLDPSSCSGCSGSSWCDTPAHAKPPAPVPRPRLWPGSKPAPGGCEKEWSKRWRQPGRWQAAWWRELSWPCSAVASGRGWRRENKRRAGWSPPQRAEGEGTPGQWGRTGQGGAHRKS